MDNDNAYCNVPAVKLTTSRDALERPSLLWYTAILFGLHLALEMFSEVANAIQWYLSGWPFHGGGDSGTQECMQVQPGGNGGLLSRPGTPHFPCKMPWTTLIFLGLKLDTNSGKKIAWLPVKFWCTEGVGQRVGGYMKPAEIQSPCLVTLNMLPQVHLGRIFVYCLIELASQKS